ncbi:hypothetical protein C8Q75DRAFT_887250 [Abortiporus biennis]|nr:hypothetical protein C8Q75DRAFT_887250 [Abortiporus biennis]
MPSDLFSLARNKLQSVVGGNVKDSSSLHRWVLLKNSIVRSHPSPAASEHAATKAADETVYRPNEDEVHEEVEHDAFMFPDPDFLASKDCESGSCEDQWLDSVLEDLGDDEDDLVYSVSVPSHEDDEPLSPLYSPMSSSDDLVEHSNFYYSSDISIPYPIPYPPLHPPLIPSWFEVESSTDSFLGSSPPLYHDPLPYFETDDLEDCPVPDAIEDTSDDESDAPSTPCTNSASSLSSIDPASIPLPRERTRLHSQPHVYIDSNDSYFYPFELDPLPFPDDERADSARAFRRAPLCQEC